MNDVQVIDIGHTQDKWLKLMLHLQNGVPNAYCLTFPDPDTAKNAAIRMRMVMKRRHTWFSLLISQTGAEVYVVKTTGARKVVIRDEPC